ncbi:MAG TPA: hypothetical protein VL326_19350 [Kofleriaceae bacterium]|nr:hypothetical protein [Kofleriaceae bacterium]
MGSVVLVPGVASAGHHGDSDGPTVRDHRTHDSHDSHDGPVVRDHRTHDSHDSHDGPVVRDHRTHDTAVVRDHRSDRSDRYDGGDVYFVSGGSDEVIVDNGGGGADPFANMIGPTWMFEMGGFARRFRGPSMSRQGSVETFDGGMADYGLASGTPTAGDTAAGAFGMRFSVATGEHSYAGVELGIGGLTRTPVRLMSDPDIHLSSQTLIDTAAVVGVRARAGIAELDGEVAGGVRVVSMTVQQMDAYEDDPSETESSASGLLEARLRGLLYVTPHVYLAAQAGVGVLDRSDVNVGLSIGLTSRPRGQAR